MDALLLSVLSWRNPHFLTRADVFKNQFIDKFLRGLKMLPIYRKRDGIDSMKMNEAIFAAAKKILTAGGVVGIFPEGSHSLTYRIRPLKKGIARIAFLSEEAADFQLDLKIIPVGIHYESYFLSSGRTLVTFGKPIRVADFKDDFKINQNVAFENLTSYLRERMKEHVIHFGNNEDYEKNLTIYQEKRIYKRDLTEQLHADQALVKAIESGGSFDEKSDKRNIVMSAFWNTWILLWKIISFIPKTLVDPIIKKTVKDPHFYATMRFGYSIFLYPIILMALYFFIRFLVFYI